MSRQLPREDDQPWYRQFWPWFLIALPSVVVVASLSTVFVATRGADDLVDDEYYKDGLAINQELSRLEKASELGIAAHLQLDGETVVVRVEGPVHGQQLRLQLTHPMEADRDFQVMLVQSTPGEYRGRLGSAVAPRWHWSLEPESGYWRLDGALTEADFARGDGG